MEHAPWDVAASVAEMGGSDPLILTPHLKWASRMSGASSGRAGVDFVFGAGNPRWRGLVDWSFLCHRMRWVCGGV